MAQHGGQAVAIGEDAQGLGADFHPGHGRGAGAHLRDLGEHLGDVHGLGRLPLQAVPAQLLQHAVHLGDRVVHGADRVLDEGRVLQVALRVGDHEGELGHQVLQVMDHEGRDAVEGLELAGIGELLGGPHECEVARDLAADRLQEVGVLPVEGEVGPGLAQHDEAEERGTLQERHHQPRAGHPGEPLGDHEAGVELGLAGAFGEVHDELAGLEEAGERAARGLAHVARVREVVAGDGTEGLRLVAQPQDPAGRLDDGGDRLDGVLAQLLPGAGPGEGVDEAQPLLAVVVLVFEEVPVEEELQTCPGRAGEEQEREEHRRPEEEHRLEGGAPLAAVGPDVVAGRGHDQEVGARPHQRRRVEDDGLGGEDRNRPLGVALDRDGEQRNDEGVDGAPGGPDRGVYPVEEERVGVEVEVVGEDPAESQAEEFDRPAPVDRGVAVELLHEQQPADREQHVAGEEQVLEGVLREAEGPGEAEDPQEGLGQGREKRERPEAVEAEGEPREAPRGRARAPVAEEPGEEGEPGDGAQGLERLRPGTGLCAEEGLRGEEQEPRGGQAGGREEEPALDPATPADGEQRRER